MSEWDALVGFIFYVCPCTLLFIWLTSLSESTLLFRIIGIIFTIIGCTLLHQWMSPDKPLDAAIADIKKQMSQKRLDEY